MLKEKNQEIQTPLHTYIFYLTALRRGFIRTLAELFYKLFNF